MAVQLLAPPLAPGAEIIWNEYEYPLSLQRYLTRILLLLGRGEGRKSHSTSDRHHALLRGGCRLKLVLLVRSCVILLCLLLLVRHERRREILRRGGGKLLLYAVSRSPCLRVRPSSPSPSASLPAVARIVSIPVLLGVWRIRRIRSSRRIQAGSRLRHLLLLRERGIERSLYLLTDLNWGSLLLLLLLGSDDSGQVRIHKKRRARRR